MKLGLCTSNEGKWREFERILKCSLERAPLEFLEIQTLDTEAVCRAKGEATYALLQRPVLVDDTGFEIDGLAGATRTSAEMDDAEKNAFSPRGLAVEQLAAFLTNSTGKSITTPENESGNCQYPRHNGVDGPAPSRRYDDVAVQPGYRLRKSITGRYGTNGWC